MNKNAKKWVAALRSRKYGQCRGELCKIGKDYDRFCCLGVACDLFQIEKGTLEITIDKPSYERYTRIKYNDHGKYLPELVRQWLGLKSDLGDYNYDSLASDNDNRKSFKQIAKIIEDNEKELFYNVE